MLALMLKLMVLLPVLVVDVPPAADEFDFHVSNLAVDLRDGVRLTRLMEVVTGEWGLAAGLRVPAVSRLQASSCYCHLCL